MIDEGVLAEGRLSGPELEGRLLSVVAHRRNLRRHSPKYPAFRQDPSVRQWSIIIDQTDVSF